MFILAAAVIAMSNANLNTLPAPKTLDAYDVIWDSPSKDSAGSMPIGNGEVVLNVWVEDKTGDVLFLIGRTDSLSEISRVLKLGRVRVHLSPSPFKASKSFRQHLHLRDGRIEISGPGSKLSVFVDSSSNSIAVSGTTKQPTTVTAEIECWRNARRVLPEGEKHSAWSVHDAPFELAEAADVFVTKDANAVTWYHRNESTVVPQLLANQSLTGLAGAFDPLLHRTFGGRLTGTGFVRSGDRSLVSGNPVKQFDLTLVTHTAQTATASEWLKAIKSTPKPSPQTTQLWWNNFWARSWVFVDGDEAGFDVPKNDFPLRQGVDSNGQNVFPGQMDDPWVEVRPEPAASVRAVARIDRGRGYQLPPGNPEFTEGFTFAAWIRPDHFGAGRIFDKVTAGRSDGTLFDMQPGGTLRLIVGETIWVAPNCLKAGEWQHVAATYDSETGSAVLYVNGKIVLGSEKPKGSAVTRGYVLQRYVQACQGRGQYPIKFNGGTYTVEPTAMGRPFNPDWRNWGDSHWFQNVRHMYHPMLQSGDFEMMQPFFQLYEAARPLAESRTQKYHQAKGAYFPETMTVFGTYSGGDYGWDRTGKQPKDVDCQYWQYAWNQGPELLDLMLDYWEYTGDDVFLKKRLIPMATSVLNYFDTRFQKDLKGRIILDPTQVVETYWHGVVNDMPTVSGLISVTHRLCALSSKSVPGISRKFFEKMKAACPELPLETKASSRQLAPAQKYNTDVSNVENGELYGVWPSRVVSLGNPRLLPEAKVAYANRHNHLDVGWGYDGNVAALLGLTDEAARILRVKCANSNPAYRWPATWGPNFDWLPDQNHGGNLLNTANLMLLQSEPIEAGGAIRVLPSWPAKWDVDFKLHAPGNTTIQGVLKGGKLVSLEVIPKSRRKDVIIPVWAKN